LSPSSPTKQLQLIIIPLNRRFSIADIEPQLLDQLFEDSIFVSTIKFSSRPKAATACFWFGSQRYTQGTVMNKIIYRPAAKKDD